MDVGAIIAEQTIQLQQLHDKLGLPEGELSKDTTRIETAIKDAITSVVVSRANEVAEWETRIAQAKRDVLLLGRAVGDQSHGLAAATRRESEAVLSLPLQHQHVVQQWEGLEAVYRERLGKIEELFASVNSLSVLLGLPFEAPTPLEVVLECAPPTDQAPRPAEAAAEASVAATRRLSMLPPHPHPRSVSNSRRPSTMMMRPPQPEAKEVKVERWFDVSEKVMAVLEEQYALGLKERETRAKRLETYFVDLAWFFYELGMPPLGTPEFTIYLLPSQDQEEVPGAHARYQQDLARVIALNPWDPNDEGGEVEFNGMDGIEPEIGLMVWCDNVLQKWEEEKEKRDKQIQDLFEQIEPLWTRLGESQEYIDKFIETHHGSRESHIEAYQEELARITEIRRASLSDFVIKTRKEIETLQDALMMSDDEKADFGALIDDRYTEELLEEHEEEARRLRAEVELRGAVLPKVKEWFNLCRDEEELEKSANDPDRFKRRGKWLFEEEKKRNRVEKRKPKIEGELLKAVEVWETEKERPFLANGERVIDTIENARAAKEAAKEAKRLAKLGLGATSSASSRSAAAPKSQPGTVRKRAAPTPAGSSAMGTKRPRIASGTAAGSRVVSNSSVASSARLRRPSPNNFETPTPKFGARPARAFGQPAVGAQANGRHPTSSTSAASTKQPARGLADLAKGEGRRPRKSFRPRQSLAAGLLSARVADDLLEEDEDDVF